MSKIKVACFFSGTRCILCYSLYCGQIYDDDDDDDIGPTFALVWTDGYLALEVNVN